MKPLKIDQLGIVVNSIESALKFYSEIFGLKLEGEEVIADQKVKTAYLMIGNTEVELLESIAPYGPVAKFIEKKGKGLQHIALRWKALIRCYGSLKKKDPAYRFHPSDRSRE